MINSHQKVDNLNGTFTFILPINHAVERTSDHYRHTLSILARSHTVIGYHHYYKSINLRRILSERKKKPWIKRSMYGNLYNIIPLHPLPFDRLSVIQKINDTVSYLLILFVANKVSQKNSRIILWIANPIFYWIVPLSKLIFSKRLIVVYDCLDFLTSSNRKIECKLRRGEQFLLRNADIVTVNNDALFSLHKKKRKDIRLVPSGFRLDDFKNSKKSISNNIFGYIGTISNRINFKLLLQIVTQNPEYNFEIVGPVYKEEDGYNQTRKALNRVLAEPNVTWKPFQKPAEIGNIISRWTAGIIPYDMNLKINQYCQPLKVMEFFYQGIPIISAPIQSLKKYSEYISTCDNHQEWTDQIKKISSSQRKKDTREITKKIAVSNSWENKINHTIQYFKVWSKNS
jgi:hypothetical protein